MPFYEFQAEASVIFYHSKSFQFSYSICHTDISVKKIYYNYLLWRTAHPEEDLGQHRAVELPAAVFEKRAQAHDRLSCPKCGVLKQGVPEDLDEFAAEILEEM